MFKAFDFSQANCMFDPVLCDFAKLSSTSTIEHVLQATPEYVVKMSSTVTYINLDVTCDMIDNIDFVPFAGDCCSDALIHRKVRIEHYYDVLAAKYTVSLGNRKHMQPCLFLQS